MLEEEHEIEKPSDGDLVEKPPDHLAPDNRSQDRQVLEQSVQPQLTVDEKDRLIAQLRQDLSSTQFDLQSLVEERDARNQEFVSEKKDLQSEIAVAARELNRTEDQLRELTAHLFTIQEDERQHVARELHDDISQRLGLLQIALQEIEAAKPQEKSSKLATVREQLDTLNSDVRAMSHRLHPAILIDLGLSTALKDLVTEFGHRENMPATYASENLPESWPQEASIALYRITQEALRNVSKHAGKTHVKVWLSGKNNSLQLKIMDFGIGFDQDSETPIHGLGMISMQERARLAGGSMQVHSALGQGTTITVDVPVRLDR